MYIYSYFLSYFIYSSISIYLLWVCVSLPTKDRYSVHDKAKTKILSLIAYVYFHGMPSVPNWKRFSWSIIDYFFIFMERFPFLIQIFNRFSLSMIDYEAKHKHSNVWIIIKKNKNSHNKNWTFSILIVAIFIFMIIFSWNAFYS